MQPETVQQLLDLNGLFYRSFGKAFAATRKRIQPGVARLLAELPREGNWLDLGCGSGAVAAAWGKTPGRSGRYVGVDFSPVLLREAKEAAVELKDGPYEFSFIQGDLAAADWWHALEDTRFDIVTAFAVLHHIPGSSLRKLILNRIHQHTRSGGLFIFSVWQLQHSPRLLERVQPWRMAGLSDDLVDEGDVLMDWRYTLPGEPEQVGLRYVHIFSDDELQQMAKNSGFSVQESFESDGQGGRLGLYQIWKKD